jgi:hypothetical protein
MADNSLLSKTEVVIQDYNNNSPVIFSGLILNESMISVNDFSFLIRPDNNESNLDSIVKFKKAVLGKEVTITFKDGGGQIGHSFKGLALEINACKVDDRFYEFYVSGSGVFSKVNEIGECHSFYKKNLDAIIDKAFESSSLKSKIKKNPQTTRELHYTVQYNQSLFSFMSALAVRFGEWMYYDGEQLIFGKKPEGNAVELAVPGDASNLNIRARAIKKPEEALGLDIFKGENIKSTKKEKAPGNPLLTATEDSGDKIFENPGKDIFLSSAFKQEESDEKYKLEQLAIIASSVFLTGTTRNTKLHPGSVIRIKEGQDSGGSGFIVTETRHSAENHNNYFNSFTAVPQEVPVPPYTNPLFFPRANPQAAIVTDNEDDAGLARVKVKFPWMSADEKSPWISLLVPHAGKDKGFRFLPEKDDEVMVDFWDANAETPFVNGAVYTQKNKPGIAEKGNNIKLIGTRTGRRLEIDDEAGIIKVSDWKDKDAPGNSMRMELTNDKMELVLSSGTKDEFMNCVLNGKQKKAYVGGFSNHEPIVGISLDMAAKKVTIFSKGDIEIQADKTISLNASEINLNASNINLAANDKLKMKGTTESSLEAMKIKINADVSLEAKSSATASLEGSMLDLKGSGIANLQGGLVKIN